MPNFDDSSLYGERFKDLLRTRLMECGWNDQVALLCRKTLAERYVNEPDELYNEVAPKARSLVPDSLKHELLIYVKEHLLKEAGYYN